MSGRAIIIAGIALLLCVVYWGILEFRPDEKVNTNEVQPSLRTHTPGKGISNKQSQMPLRTTAARDTQATARKTLRPNAEESLPGHDQTGVVYDQSAYPAFGEKPQDTGPVLDADSREPVYTTDTVVQDTGPVLDADSREPVYTTDTVVQDTGPVLDADSREPVYTTDTVVQDTGPVLDADEAYRMSGQR